MSSSDNLGLTDVAAVNHVTSRLTAVVGIVARQYCQVSVLPGSTGRRPSSSLLQARHSRPSKSDCMLQDASTVVFSRLGASVHDAHVAAANASTTPAPPLVIKG
jgi:hypothetical protein